MYCRMFMMWFYHLGWKFFHFYVTVADLTAVNSENTISNARSTNIT